MSQNTNKYSADIDRLREENPFISSTQLVYTILHDRIIDHRLAPGKKLNQEQIAIDMSVSRTPVREAFSMLEDEGFLEKGAQGYSVYVMTPGNYVQLLEVRIALEALAARLACSQMIVSERRGLERNIKEADDLLAKGIGTAWDNDFNITNDAAAFVLFHQLGEKDQEFHRMVMLASHNKFLIDAYGKMSPMIHFYRFSAFTISSCLNMTERHKKIYAAIKSRDENMAEERMRTHLSLTIPRAMGI